MAAAMVVTTPFRHRVTRSPEQSRRALLYCTEVSTYRFQSADIDEVWERIEPGLRIVAQRTHAPWEPGHVHAAVRNGDAQLMTVPEGFIVWRIKVCEFTEQVTFWLWIAYGEGGGIIERYEEQIVELARACGAERIAFESPRRGYLRRMRRPWQVAQVQYERAV
jgi:hypothetical protein